MADQRYRVRVPIQGVSTEARSIVIIPEGASLSVDERPEGQHMIKVRWEGRAFLVFEQDLLERAITLQAGI